MPWARESPLAFYPPLITYTHPIQTQFPVPCSLVSHHSPKLLVSLMLPIFSAFSTGFVATAYTDRFVSRKRYAAFMNILEMPLYIIGDKSPTVWQHPAQKMSWDPFQCCVSWFPWDNGMHPHTWKYVQLPIWSFYFSKKGFNIFILHTVCISNILLLLFKNLV